MNCEREAIKIPFQYIIVGASLDALDCKLVAKRAGHKNEWREYSCGAQPSNGFKSIPVGEAIVPKNEIVGLLFEELFELFRISRYYRREMESSFR